MKIDVSTARIPPFVVLRHHILHVLESTLLLLFLLHVILVA